jgi:hypothetical protein
MSARCDQRKWERLCLCGCGLFVTIPRRKDGYRQSRKCEPVRSYATRACALKFARAARQRQRAA